MSIVAINSGAASHHDVPGILWKLDWIDIGSFGKAPVCAISALGDKLRGYVNICIYLDIHMFMYTCNSNLYCHRVVIYCLALKLHLCM